MKLTPGIEPGTSCLPSLSGLLPIVLTKTRKSALAPHFRPLQLLRIRQLNPRFSSAIHMNFHTNSSRLALGSLARQ